MVKNILLINKMLAINEINLENGEQLSRTIINMPVSTYLTMTFAVIQS